MSTVSAKRVRPRPRRRARHAPLPSGRPQSRALITGPATAKALSGSSAQEHRRAGRGASAPDPARVCSLLQYCENAPVIGPGCSGLSSGSADRTHRVARLGWRAASRIRPDLGFRHAQGTRRAPNRLLPCRKFILRGAAARLRLGFDPVHGPSVKTVCAKERSWQRWPILGFQAAFRSTR
jgi:hypothetical protein